MGEKKSAGSENKSDKQTKSQKSKSLNQDLRENMLYEIRRATMLFDLTKMFARAGDDISVLYEIIAQHVAQHIGEVCVIMQRTPEKDTLSPVAVYHPNPGARAAFAAIMSSISVNIGNGYAGKVVSTGESIIVNMNSHAQMKSKIRREFWPYAERYGLYDYLVVPMKVDSDIIGTIGVMRLTPGQTYNQQDKLFLEDIAGRAALAITNIRLYRELHKSHEELEQKIKERTLELQKSNSLLKKEISRRKKNEEVLRITEEKYRTIADFTYDWETWTSPEGKYLYISPACESITGYKRKEFMDDTDLLVKITHPEDKSIIKEHLEELEKGNVNGHELDYRIITRNNNIRWISHSCSPVYDRNGKYIGQRGSNRDITLRKNNELELMKSQQQLRALTMHLNGIAEEERKNIAREIHDELGHNLTALKFDLESLLSKCELAEELSKELSSSIHAVETLMTSVQQIATQLRPGVLDHLGLFPAIEWQIKQFQSRTKINCEYHADENHSSFNLNETNVIFRIFQEILTNIARHSKAKNVHVVINNKDDFFVLKVIDDGIGFDSLNENLNGSLGLLGMHERALSIGGEIVIDSKKSKGTRIVFTLNRGKS